MEKKNTGMKVAIVVLCLLVVGLTGYIVYNKILNQDNDLVDNVENNNIGNQGSNDLENNKNTINTTIEKYLGTWYLGPAGSYTYVNIKNSKTSSTNYAIDIRVNKEADYTDLDLYCYDNAGVCYFSADENHNFVLLMAYNQVQVLPDYALIGTSWTFANK